jgi:hypothetical protein
MVSNWSAGNYPMNLMVQVVVFAAAIVAGLFLGGFVPKALVKDAWRLPIAVALIAAGIAIAALVWSR